jgi:DNA-binding response OmpR family regulator
MKIIIVDDEKIILKLLCKSLSKDGHEVTVYSSGIPFCDELDTENLPDVVMLDIVMPEITGIDVFKKIMSKCEKPPKIIFISAFDFTGELNKLIKENEVWFLPKPFSINEMRKVLEKVEETLNIVKKCDSGEYQKLYDDKKPSKKRISQSHNISK